MKLRAGLFDVIEKRILLAKKWYHFRGPAQKWPPVKGLILKHTFFTAFASQKDNIAQMNHFFI